MNDDPSFVKPPLNLGGGLAAFLEAGDSTLAAMLAVDSKPLAAIRQFDDFLRSGPWDVSLINPMASVLFINGYMLFLSGVRTALTGQPAAVFPLIRAALESAAYGLIMAAEPGKAEVYLRRHDSDHAKNEARKSFTLKKALPHLAAQLEARKLVEELYDATIDWGAHPNPRGVLRYMTFAEEGKFVSLNLGGVHGPGEFVDTALMACLDVAVAIGAIMVSSSTSPTEGRMAELQRLNDMKNAVAAEYHA